MTWPASTFNWRLSTRPSAALARLAVERFDALILDGMLPEMDGFEFCKRLRAGSEPWRDMPVLMLTSAWRPDRPCRRPGAGRRRLPAQDPSSRASWPRELQTILRRTRFAPPSCPGAATDDAAVLRRPADRHGTPRGEGRWWRHRADRHRVRTAGHAGKASTGKVFSRDDILNRLRRVQEAELYTRAVDILVSRLRRKLEHAGRLEDIAQCGLLLRAAREIAEPPLRPPLARALAAQEGQAHATA